MKCNQKLCQRTKNVNQNGNCNVCEEVLENAKKAHEKIDQNKTVQRVALDMKQMVDMHKKLTTGIKIDPQDVSVLLLGGVINILSQHDALESLEERIKSLEHNNITNKTRIESLENWVVSQSDLINMLDEKLSAIDKNGVIIKENIEIETLKTKISSLESDNSTSKNCKVNSDVKELRKKISVIELNLEKRVDLRKKCKECGKVFIRNSDFERHMEEEHGVEKAFKCDICGKMFLLEWRLEKHGDVHTKQTRKCKFFLNKELCPFSEIGCKFVHDHDDQDDEIETIEEDYNLNQNQCHLCRLQLSSRDEVMDHVEVEHKEYFQGVLEYAAANRT